MTIISILAGEGPTLERYNIRTVTQNTNKIVPFGFHYFLLITTEYKLSFHHLPML